MDLDDNIDRYLTKMSESGRRPQSRQWLRWLIEDDAGSRERERIALQVQSLVHDDGTPTTWTV